MAHKRVMNSGNVALELVVAISLTVTFVLPSAEMVSQIFRSKTELTESFTVLSRTFQITPYDSVKMNMNTVRVLLQRESKRNLRILLNYNTNSDGLVDSVTIKSIIETGSIGITELSESEVVKRSVYVS